ncbi:hypothetical protein X772_16190 [Mesorhizobium sp. LSJC280B00]|nr:hypothetical protein X772_16190 [Mesorhizobium sp. LSJC280B00]
MALTHSGNPVVHINVRAAKWMLGNAGFRVAILDDSVIARNWSFCSQMESLGVAELRLTRQLERDLI